MAVRTDLAIELSKSSGNVKGIRQESISFGRVNIERVYVDTLSASKKIGKPIGKYVTISFDKFRPEDTKGDLHSAIRHELSSVVHPGGMTLVAGLGNEKITPDALGPKTVNKIFVTRHISAELRKEAGLGVVEPVAAVCPGVLGHTGIEAAELIFAAVKETKPDSVIVIDALAARELSRLGSTVQISDTGINPGSGVGNSRTEISYDTIGVPVVSIGVPTVVDAETFVENIGSTSRGAESMMVTPRDIDEIVNNASSVISHAINCVLQPEIKSEILLNL